MAVRIRLRRMGRKKQPHYRIVVADAASPREGRVVETIGYYRPLGRPARLVVNLERVDHWLRQGASLSTTVESLLKKARKGGDKAVAVGEPEQAARTTAGAGTRPRARKRGTTAAEVAPEALPGPEGREGPGGPEGPEGSVGGVAAREAAGNEPSEGAAGS
ncbi:MAG: 30S ribosomal protein S16 [Gemmatimonadetes bacterium]|nr:30S ribosomal protein S16 [Gemmatimonadota bacterium]